MEMGLLDISDMASGTSEAKLKEEKMKMCKYSPDLSMECSCFQRMLNNSIHPFSQCKCEQWRYG